MAESKTVASTSADVKEKASLVDEDIGKEFFGSWKSMSVTEDDAMDFNFETVPKGKKNTFNFDKLDMDFNLGGEFEKMSSFKVDMADLDFSSPPKKNTKPKEKSEEESSSGKQNRFAFSFDFNELDDFNFDSSLTKGDKKSKCTDSHKATADITDGQGSRIDDRESAKPPPSERVTTSKAANMVSSLDGYDTMRDYPPEKSATFENLVVPHEVRNTLEKTTTTRAKETDQQNQPSEKTVSTEPSTLQTILDVPVQSVPKKNSTQDAVTELQAEVGLVNTRFNAGSGEEENVDTRMLFDSAPNHENMKMKNASLMHIRESQSNNSEKSKLACNNHGPVESTSGSEGAKDDMDLEDTSTTRVSGRMLRDANASSESQNLTSKLPLATLSSGAMVGKLTTIKEKDTGVIRSRFFKRSEETESQPQQASSTQSKKILLEKKIICTVDSSPVDIKRERSNANHAQIGSNMIVDSSSDAGGSTTNEPFLSGSGNNATKSNNVSFQVNASSSIEQATKSSTQKSVNPKLLVPSMPSMRKIVSVERNKLSSLKAARRTPDLSSLNISGSVGAQNGLSNSKAQKELKSLRNSDLSMEVHESTVSKMAHSIGTEKQAPLTPSLKRKTCEASNADLMTLNPLKRLSESPSETRVREASERVQEQVFNHKNQVNSNTKNSFCDSLTSTLNVPREVNMTELEIPLVLENDGNVEKAEAYTKELEDICNMLKKKHEEAKELLVRAVVNNNNLLMLNHPIYEEKISSKLSSDSFLLHLLSFGFSYGINIDKLLVTFFG